MPMLELDATYPSYWNAAALTKSLSSHLLLLINYILEKKKKKILDTSLIVILSLLYSTKDM